MDGNRRWAVRQGLLSIDGHRKGFDSISLIIDFCREKGMEYLSLYTFSIENLKRSSEEIYSLFEVLAYEVVDQVIKLKEKNVKVVFIGDRSLFPKSVKPLCEKAERETKECDGLQVNFLLCYGGRQEIVDTARRIAIKVKKGDLQESDITENVFERFLWTTGTPCPDLIIRTGGDRRLSNFLLFQAAYSELYFLDCLWPDITTKDLESAVNFFHHRRYNSGT